jgi:hypothetical protein
MWQNRALVALIPLVFGGCAVTPSYQVPPMREQVMVRINWSNNDQIRRRCGPTAFACATIGTPNVPMSQIYAEKPAGRSDKRRVCTLGHEFLHSLGARLP